MKDKDKKEYAIDKVKAPPEGYEQYDYVGTLLESVKSDFRAFGETLDFIRRDIKDVKKRGDATFEEVGNLKTEFDEFKEDATERLDRIEDKLEIRKKVEV